MDKTIIGVLAELANVGDTEVDELFVKGDDGQITEELKPADEIAGTIRTWFENKMQSISRNQHGRGMKETAKRWESALAELGYDKSKGIDGLSEWVESLKTPDGDGTGIEEMPPEKLAKLPNVRALLDEQVAELKQALDAERQQREQDKKQWTRKQVETTANQRAIEILDGMNWASGESPDERKRRVRTIQRLLNHDELTLDDDGNIIVVDADGEPRVDKLHNPVSFKQYVADLNPFGTHKKAPDKKGGGVRTKISGGASDAPVFNSEQEFTAYMERETDPKKRAAAYESFSASHTNATAS